MFNHIQLELQVFKTYQFGFLTTNTDTITHLIHWQYWWWFWFTLLLSLYFIFLIRFLFFRSLKFNAKLVTSYRSHGKWGDLIICLLPVSWCLNILSNSTTLLKLLEWQSESSFFMLRVRGKQWYWVYKLELNSLLNIVTKSNCFPQIGTNKIIDTVSVYSANNTVDITPPHDIQYIFTSNELKNDVQNLLYNTLKLTTTKFSLVKMSEFHVFKQIKFFNNITKTNFPNFRVLKFSIPEKIIFLPQNLKTLAQKLQPTFQLYLDWRGKNWTWCVLGNFHKFIKPVTFFSNSYFEEKKIIFSPISTARFFRETTFNLNNIRLLKAFHYYEDFSNDWFCFLRNPHTKILSFNFFVKKIKPLTKGFYFTLKQKPISEWSKYDTSAIFFKNSFKEFFLSYGDSFLFNGSNKVQYINNMRLLRLNKLLFLPTRYNITVVTNSFDVIHSWFIPGLGLKMDCVPGRSTHHTIYIDIPGIYYGQCAEICGRFHHHMPIRICALDLPHFLLWFNHFVLPSIKNLDPEMSANSPELVFKRI